MKSLLPTLLILLLLKGHSFLYGQDFLAKEFVIKVKTGNGWIKGTLTAMSDSSISMLRLNRKEMLRIPVITIYKIKVKRPILKSAVTDAMVLSIVGGLLVTNYYVQSNFITPADPPFGRSLWTTMAVGAGAGFVVGCAQSAFVKINIPVRNSVQLFNEKKYRLAKYMAY